MPLYEYDCEKCGTFEVSQKMNDAPLTKHEPCGHNVTRRISRSSFSLKGSGWAAEGYGSANANSMCSTGGCGGGGCSS